MILISAFLAIAKVQASPRVSFSTAGDPAYRVLAQLGPKIGRLLEASPQTKDDVLVIDVNDVPVDALLGRIAEVVNGSWRQEKGSWRLVRTAQQLRAEEETEIRFQAELFRRDVTARVAQSLAKNPFTKESAQTLGRAYKKVLQDAAARRQRMISPTRVRRAGMTGPESRALSLLLTQLDPLEVGKLETQVKTVFSNIPTPSQRPISGKCQIILDQWVKEHSMWLEASEKMGLTDVPSDDTPALVNEGSFQPMLRPGGSVAGLATKFLLGVTPYRQGGFRVTLDIADAKGRRIASASDVIGFEWDDEGQERVTLPGDESAAMEVPKSLTAFYTSGVLRKENFTTELKNSLLHPEQTEPLSIFSGAWLAEAARKKKSNLVGLLQDESSVTGTNSPDQKANAFLENLRHGSSNVRELDGWILISPKRPLAARAARVDRKALGEVLRDPNPGLQSVDVLANRLLKNARMDQPLLAFHRSLTQSGVFFGINDENLTIFFAGFSAPARQALLSGNPVSLASLNQTQVAALREIVYGERSPLLSSADEQNNVSWGSTITNEPTECFPRGIPPQGVVRVAVEEVPVAISEAPIGFDNWGYDAGKMAATLARLKNPELYVGNRTPAEDPSKMAFRFGKRKTLTIKINFTPDVYYSNQLRTFELGTGGPMPYDQLPADYRRLVDQQVEIVRASMKGNGG